MQFFDFGGSPVNIKVCAQFPYKGYKISASTIFTPYANVVIMDANDDFVQTDIATIEEAIRIVDTLI